MKRIIISILCAVALPSLSFADIYSTDKYEREFIKITQITESKNAPVKLRFELCDREDTDSCRLQLGKRDYDLKEIQSVSKRERTKMYLKGTAGTISVIGLTVAGFFTGGFLTFGLSSAQTVALSIGSATGLSAGGGITAYINPVRSYRTSRVTGSAAIGSSIKVDNFDRYLFSLDEALLNLN